MKILKKLKDGGPESNVTGYFLVEIKWLFSIVLLRFSPGSREAFHGHAFNSTSWILNGILCEYRKGWPPAHHLHFFPRWRPWRTLRTDVHKVFNPLDTPVWAISLRGPWEGAWWEYNPTTKENILLINGRKIVHRETH